MLLTICGNYIYIYIFCANDFIKLKQYGNTEATTTSKLQHGRETNMIGSEEQHNKVPSTAKS